MARTSLPPGFRFHPTDVELVKYYLKRKVMGKRFRFEAISELNIYKFCPSDLPDKSCLRSKDREWYFFCPRERKYASGGRTSRITENGYWKTTGMDRPVVYNEQTVGKIKTLVFHQGRAPQGKRTDWVMHEYRIEDQDLADAGIVQDAYVLCKIFKKSGPGPNNGAQYGAPFNEEDWDDDAEDGLSPAALVPPNNQNSSVVTSMLVPGSTCSMFSSEAGPSNAVPFADEEVPQPLPNDDNLDSLLAMFTEDDTLLPSENNDNMMLDNFNGDQNIAAVSPLDGNDIYSGLVDLGNLAELNEGGFNFACSQKASYALNSMFLADDSFLELNDLNCPLICPTEASGAESFLTDGISASYKCNYEEQNCYPVNSFGAVQHVSGLSRSPVPPEGFNGHGGPFDVFQKENDVGESSNQGCNTSYNVDFTHKRPEE